MKRARLLVALTVPLLACGSSLADPDRHVHESAIDVDGVRYTLRTISREATLRPGLPGVLVHYTVRREGAFCHPEDWDGGRLVGCRYAHWDPGELIAEPFPDAKRPVGWILALGAICGNTFSRRVRLVTVSRIEHENAYREATFEAKVPPLARWVARDLEVWSIRQDWGRGVGTAASLFVPEVRVVRPDGTVEPRPLTADFGTWPESEWGRSHRSMFVAGVRQRNAALLRSVLAEWDNPGEDGAHDAFGLPHGRKALEDLTRAVDGLARARTRLSTLTRSFR